MDPLIGTIIISAFNWSPVGFAFCQGQSLTIQQYQALYSLIGTLYGQQNTSSFNLPNLSGRAPLGAGQLSGGGLYPLAKQIGAETVTLNQMNLPMHNHNATFQPTMGDVQVTIPATTGNLAVTATPNLTASGNANLAVTANAKIGTTNSTGRSQNIGDNALITSTPLSNAAIYAPVANGATTVIGPAGAVTGTATGTVNSTVSGSIATTVTGAAGAAAVTATVNTVKGGAVAIGNTGANAPFSSLQPSLVMNFIIALNGFYPDRAD